MFGNKEEKVTVDEAIKTEEAKPEVAEEVKKADADPKKDISKEKIALMKDGTNEEHFAVGQKMSVKDLPFKIMEVKGIDLVLRRTDIK